MSRRNDRPETESSSPPPESGMGGASDFGAHGRHPASAPDLHREGRSTAPEDVPGDAAIERRRALDPDYTGPERRQGRR
jgi:hypothetical protein